MRVQSQQSTEESEQDFTSHSDARDSRCAGVASASQLSALIPRKPRFGGVFSLADRVERPRARLHPSEDETAQNKRRRHDQPSALFTVDPSLMTPGKCKSLNVGYVSILARFFLLSCIGVGRHEEEVALVPVWGHLNLRLRELC